MLTVRLSFRVKNLESTQFWLPTLSICLDQPLSFFFESETGRITVPPITLKRRRGNSDGMYTLRAIPEEALVFGNEETSITLELTTPINVDLSENTLEFQLNHYLPNFSNFPASICDSPSSPWSNPDNLPFELQNVITEQITAGSGEVHSINLSLGHGVYDLAVTNLITSAPQNYPLLSTSTISSTRSLQIRINEQPTTDTFWVLRSSFYTGTSNELIIGGHDDCTMGDLVARNYFFRDQAGFDIDRPSNDESGNISEYPSEFDKRLPTDPQDSDFFVYDNDMDRFPNLPGMSDNEPPPPSVDLSDIDGEGLEEYPKPVEGTSPTSLNQLRWRAFLSFNSQISGTAFGTLDDFSSEDTLTGTTFFAGSMPLITRPRSD
jgi:hypothetical protein